LATVATALVVPPVITVEAVTDIVTLIGSDDDEFSPAPPQLLVPIAAGRINTNKIATVCIVARLVIFSSFFQFSSGREVPRPRVGTTS
jgi:hypothetical protein